MIDITIGEPKITEIRYTCLREFDIDVTIMERTHNLSIVVKSEEDKQGQDTDLVEIRVENMTFDAGVGVDVGLNLQGHLESWFDDNFGEFPIETTQKDFDAIFGAVWEYIEAKDLW